MVVCHFNTENDSLYARRRGNIPTNLLDAMDSFWRLSLQWFMNGRKHFSKRFTAAAMAVRAEYLFGEDPFKSSHCLVVISLRPTTFLHTLKVSGTARRQILARVVSSREPKFSDGSTSEVKPEINDPVESRMSP